MQKTRLAALLAALLATISVSAWTQQQNSTEAIKQALVSKYALTTAATDKGDNVTAGAILVVKKPDLLAMAAAQNTYKDARISHAGITPAANTSAPNRTLAVGEKVWVTGIDVLPAEVVFTLLTDAYSGVRYTATLSFPFPKGAPPSADRVAAMVGEVFDLQPSASGARFANTAAVAAPASASQATPAPVAQGKPTDVPPSPPVDPALVAVGQTIEQVVSKFGRPDRLARLSATKQVYYYKGAKVTFVNGKVTSVER
jgi:hypothetical protein